MHSPAQACEVLLARLFNDVALRERFRQDPIGVGRELGLDTADVAALARTDWVGLDLAAGSFAHKRSQHDGRKRAWWRR
ncbi:MAG TPA: hypothetical protein VF033_14005 [Steroidobacteraceae bacterium]|jgi:hypothetical protein